MLPWLMIVRLSKNYSRLVSYIFQPNANCKGCTALHYAALVDDSTSVEELLKADKLQLQPNTNCKGCTALHYAALVDDSTSVEELLKAGKLHIST